VDKASDGDLSVFFHQCVRTGLDPFAKQIYMVGRWDNRANATRYTIQTGIDGYRLIADRTGLYAGSDETWTEIDGRPVTATVTVRKVVAGTLCEFTATARWEEYVQTGKDGKPMGLWAKMPHRMLAKCAEALALRKAFPQDLSGLYTSEEMSQADNQSQQAEVVQLPQRDANPLISVDNMNRFVTACSEAGLNSNDILLSVGLVAGQVRESDLGTLRAAFKKAKDALIVEAEIVEPEPDFVEGVPVRTIEDVEAEVIEMFGAFDVTEEMKQRHPANGVPQIKEPGAPASAKQLGMIRALAKSASITTTEDLLSMVTDAVGRPVDKLDSLTKAEASNVISLMKPQGS
jgi:phage recombination protein Bet